MSTEALNLPVIDLSELDNENTRADFYRKLRHMARDIGFFYLVGHGVDPAERDDMLETAKDFFALPQDAKDKISMDNSPHFRGYTKVGGENTRNKTDYREQIDIGEEVPAHVLPEDDPNFYLNLHGPNQWPEEVPELKAKALAYQDKMYAVAVKLLRAFVVALGLPENSLDEMVSGIPRKFLKLVHYPPNTGENGDAQMQGCGPHKDACFLTLLWQDDVGGLQVLTDDRGWIDAVPLKDSYIVNIGELLELTTNGYLVADVHQVVMRRTTTKSRYTIPFFLGPNLAVREVPLLKLPPELQAQARGPSSDPLNPMFRDVGMNCIKGRLRAHKNTTKKFYPKHYAEILRNGNIALAAAAAAPAPLLRAPSTTQLPVIDLSELDDPAKQAAFYAKLRHMARDVGFFYLVGHGIDAQEREDLLVTAKRFFALPAAAKNKISMDYSPHFRGYTKVGGENTRNKPDYREELDIGEELPSRLVSEDDHARFAYNLCGPNQWPKELPELKGQALAWEAKVRAVGIKLLRAFMVALGLPADSLDYLVHGTPSNFMKISHYPPNTGEFGEGQQQGCGPHKDACILTLLWQDDVGGLQVLTDDKGWIDAVPLKDSFIVNIGELLELATNGYLIANIHQVVMPAGRNKSRYTLPFFLMPSLEAQDVPVLPLPPELAAQARGPSSDPMNPLFRNPGSNAMKGRLRSHKNTTVRFYPKHYAQILKNGTISSV